MKPEYNCCKVVGNQSIDVTVHNQQFSIISYKPNCSMFLKSLHVRG
jgi:hypothetical protein